MLANKIYHSVSFAFCGYFLEHHWKKTKIGCVASTVNFQKNEGIMKSQQRGSLSKSTCVQHENNNVVSMTSF